MKVIEIASGKVLHTFTLGGGSGSIPSVEFDAKGRHIVASGPGPALNAIKIDTGAVTVIDPGIGWVAEYRFSPDGRFMATGGMSGIIIWDARTWKELRRIGVEVMAGSRGHVGFSRDSRYVAAIDPEGHLRFWDPSTGVEVASIGEGLRPDGAVEFTQDGRVLATGLDGTMRVFGPRPAAPVRPAEERK